MCVITIIDLIVAIIANDKGFIKISIKFINAWGYLMIFCFILYKLYGPKNILNNFFVKWFQGYLEKQNYSEFEIFLYSVLFDFISGLHILYICCWLLDNIPCALVVSLLLVLIPIMKWVSLIYNFVRLIGSRLTYNIYYFFIQFFFTQNTHIKFSDQFLKIIWVTILLMIWFYFLRWSIKDFKP